MRTAVLLLLASLSLNAAVTGVVVNKTTDRKSVV